MIITRTLSTYKVQAVNVGVKNGKANVEVMGEATYTATAPSKTLARKALKGAGVNVPRGTQILTDEIETVKYGVSLEEFLAIAKPIESKTVHKK